MTGHQRGTNRWRFIYLIRHGEYEECDEHSGGVLTECGEEQARRLAEPMGKIPVDAIYSSTLHRAWQTARILRDEIAPELEIRRTPLLNERMFPGYLDEEQRDEEEEAEAREMLDKIEDRFFRPSRCERHDVLVCHGGVIRALLTRVMGAPLENWAEPSIACCGITQLVSVDDGTTELISYNERGHLPYRLRAIGGPEW